MKILIQVPKGNVEDDQSMPVPNLLHIHVCQAESAEIPYLKDLSLFSHILVLALLFEFHLQPLSYPGFNASMSVP